MPDIERIVMIPRIITTIIGAVVLVGSIWAGT